VRHSGQAASWRTWNRIARTVPSALPLPTALRARARSAPQRAASERVAHRAARLRDRLWRGASAHI